MLWILLDLKLAKNAYFTEPADQSVWFYLKWLMETRRPKFTPDFKLRIKEGSISIQSASNVESVSSNDTPLSTENGHWNCLTRPNNLTVHFTNGLKVDIDVEKTLVEDELYLKAIQTEMSNISELLSIEPEAPRKQLCGLYSMLTVCM